MKAIFNGKHTHRSLLLTAALVSISLFASVAPATAQENIKVNDRATAVNRGGNHEDFGHTFNIGLGPGFLGRSLVYSPFLYFDYEIEAAPDFTVAPFIGFSTYRSNPQTFGSNYYYYRGTIVPIGAKATYYFDDILELPYRWDLWAAGSVGFTYIKKVWENGYTGSVGEIPGVRPLFLSLHIGTEYHITDAVGIYVDLSTKASVIGVGLHM